MLSRGNRLCAGKGGTAVLDFCNTADAVRAAFGAFWGECVWRGSAAAARARCVRGPSSTMWLIRCGTPLFCLCAMTRGADRNAGECEI